MISIRSLRDTRAGLSQESRIHLRAISTLLQLNVIITCEHVNTLHHRYGLDQLYI